MYDSPWVNDELVVLNNALPLKLRNNTTPVRKGTKALCLSSQLFKYVVRAGQTVIGKEPSRSVAPGRLPLP